MRDLDRHDGSPRQPGLAQGIDDALLTCRRREAGMDGMSGVIRFPTATTAQRVRGPNRLPLNALSKENISGLRIMRDREFREQLADMSGLAGVALVAKVFN